MPNALHIESLLKLQRIGNVAVSPNGLQAVCTVTTPDLDQNRSSTSLWLLDTRGRRAPRRLTSAAGRHAQPAWSPQGDRIAFIGSREQDGSKDGTPQIYLIAPDGGEALRASAYAPGVETFRWLPHGRGLVFSSWVWPELKGAAAQARRHAEFTRRRESGYATEEAEYRHWDHLHPMGRVLHLHRLDLKAEGSGRVTDLFEGLPYELPRDDATPEAFDLRPDGRALAFAFDPSPQQQPVRRCAIAELDLATRQVRVLARDADWHFETPRYAPDGRRLALLAAHTGARHTALSRPALIEFGGKKLTPNWRALGQAWDFDAASAPRWNADGSALYLLAERHGGCPLWRCWPDDGDDGRFELADEPGWVRDFDLAGSGEAECRVLVADRADHPPRVFASSGGGTPRRLERFNDGLLRAHALGRTERHEVVGALGQAVQVWLTFPPGFDAKRRHPVTQVIHGGPYAASGDGWSWRWNAHVLAARGHVVAQVNYHGSSGFGHDFKASIMGRLAELEMQDLEAATDWLRAQPWCDPARVFATGGSYGGFMVAWMNGHAEPGRYRAYVCHAGVFDRVATFAADSYASRARDLGAWYWDDMNRVLAQSPHAAAAHMSTPTLVTHGALDYRVPDGNGLAYYHTLKAKGVPARLLWFPDENHWVLKPRNSVQWHGEFHDWLARHGGNGPDGKPAKAVGAGTSRRGGSASAAAAADRPKAAAKAKPRR